MALYDALTGLANRRSFEERLSQILATPSGATQVALVLVDLDGFKQINDTYGHPIGDSLLQVVAQRLNSCLRSGDTAYRWGGDEFALILEDIEGLDLVKDICGRVISRLAASPFQGAGHMFPITASIGAVLFTPGGQSMRSLVHDADRALYEVKRSGRNDYRVYDANWVDRSPQGVVRSNFKSDFQRALEHRELLLYFQPQIDYLSQTVVGLEALVRWQHPRAGLLTPDAFVALAESNSLALDLGEWVLREAIHQAQTWGKGGPLPTIAVNTSPVQFCQPGFATMVGDILKTTGFNPAGLELEITESTGISQLQLTQQTLAAIAQQGVKICLDDFGIGYSEFARLKQLPLQGIKIDRSLITELGADSPDRAIAQAIITLAEGLSLTVIAEGVETLAQADALKAMGCRIMQGYFFSRPILAAQVAALCWP